MPLPSDFDRARDLQAEIKRLREREESYRMALKYLADATDLPSSLKLIADEALKQ